GVDGDEKDIERFRDGGWYGVKRRGRIDFAGGVGARTVFVAPVVGDIERTGMHGGGEVVAVAAAGNGWRAIAIGNEGRTRRANQRAAESGVKGGRFAYAVVATQLGDANEKQDGQGGSPDEKPSD